MTKKIFHSQILERREININDEPIELTDTRALFECLHKLLDRPEYDTVLANDEDITDLLVTEEGFVGFDEKLTEIYVVDKQDINKFIEEGDLHIQNEIRICSKNKSLESISFDFLITIIEDPYEQHYSAPEEEKGYDPVLNLTFSVHVAVYRELKNSLSTSDLCNALKEIRGETNRLYEGWLYKRNTRSTQTGDMRVYENDKYLIVPHDNNNYDTAFRTYSLNFAPPECFGIIIDAKSEDKTNMFRNTEMEHLMQNISVQMFEGKSLHSTSIETGIIGGSILAIQNESIEKVDEELKKYFTRNYVFLGENEKELKSKWLKASEREIQDRTEMFNIEEISTFDMVSRIKEEVFRSRFIKLFAQGFETLIKEFDMVNEKNKTFAEQAERVTRIKLLFDKSVKNFTQGCVALELETAEGFSAKSKDLFYEYENHFMCLSPFIEGKTINPYSARYVNEVRGYMQRLLRFQKHYTGKHEISGAFADSISRSLNELVIQKNEKKDRRLNRVLVLVALAGILPLIIGGIGSRDLVQSLQNNDGVFYSFLVHILESFSAQIAAGQIMIAVVMFVIVISQLVKKLDLIDKSIWENIKHGLLVKEDRQKVFYDESLYVGWEKITDLDEKESFIKERIIGKMRDAIKKYEKETENLDIDIFQFAYQMICFRKEANLNKDTLGEDKNKPKNLDEMLRGLIELLARKERFFDKKKDALSKWEEIYTLFVLTEELQRMKSDYGLSAPEKRDVIQLLEVSYDMFESFYRREKINAFK